MAWSALAVIFGPVLLVLAFGGRPANRVMIAMSLGGLGVALLWRWLGWHDSVYEGMPGMLAGLLVYAVCCSLPAVYSRVKQPVQ